MLALCRPEQTGLLESSEAVAVLITAGVLQLSRRIYAKPMSLPEFILERARSSAGDTRRLHDIFQRLESGMP